MPQPLIDEAAEVVLATRPIFDPARYGVKPVDPATLAPPKNDSLYARIGGADAVQATVEVFYKKVLGDPLLVPFFSGVDMGRQRAKQVAVSGAYMSW